MRIGIKERSRKGRPSHSGPAGSLALGAFPNHVSARGCVTRTELIIPVIHTLGWGLSPGGRRGYLNTSGRMQLRRPAPPPSASVNAPKGAAKALLIRRLQRARLLDEVAPTPRAAGGHTLRRGGSLLRSPADFLVPPAPTSPPAGPGSPPGVQSLPSLQPLWLPPLFQPPVCRACKGQPVGWASAGR